MFRCLLGQSVDRCSQVQDLPRPFFRQLRDAEFVQQTQRIATSFAVVVPTDGNIVDAGHHTSGQVKVEKILELANGAGFFKDARFVFLQPQRLGDHPLG